MRSSASSSACAAGRLFRCCLSTRIGSFSLYAPPLETGALLREDLFMNRRIFTLLLGLGVAAMFAPRLAFAEDHLAEAIGHTKEAIEHGKASHADVLVTHAEAALTHAKAAENVKANPHTKEGITHLDAAIAEGKKKDAASATKQAEEALTHLEAATK